MLITNKWARLRSTWTHYSSRGRFHIWTFVKMFFMMISFSSGHHFTLSDEILLQPSIVFVRINLHISDLGKDEPQWKKILKAKPLGKLVPLICPVLDKSSVR